MAEYARYYGGLPAPELPWPLFRALCARTDRFEARVQLSLLTSVSSAIGAAFGGGPEARVHAEKLLRRAYPLRDVPPVFHPNLFAQGTPEVQA